MSIVYLVRHTDYDNPRGIMPGRLPVPLSERGISEAKKLHRYFTDKNISTIYSSRVLRCEQTSEIISDDQRPIIFDQRLLELLSPYQGYWEIKWHLFAGHVEQLGGESFQDVQDRMLDFYKELINNLKPNDNVIICSHGDPLLFLYQYIDNQPLLPHTQLTEEMSLRNNQTKGSVRPIEIQGDKTIIKPIITQNEL